MASFLMASKAIEMLEKYIKEYGDCPILIADSESPNSLCNAVHLMAIEIKPENAKEKGDIAFIFTDIAVEKGDCIEL